MLRETGRSKVPRIPNIDDGFVACMHDCISRDVVSHMVSQREVSYEQGSSFESCRHVKPSEELVEEDGWSRAAFVTSLAT